MGLGGFGGGDDRGGFHGGGNRVDTPATMSPKSMPRSVPNY
jgi:hypothetical protein